MTLRERSLFSFWLSLGGGVLGLEGGSSREVFELCVGRAATVRGGGRFKIGRGEVCEIWG